MVKFILILALFSWSNSSYSTFYQGIGVHPQSFPDGVDKMYSILNNMTINSIRFDYPWDQVEEKKGVYGIPNYNIEQTVLLAERNKLIPLLILDYGNPLYIEKDKLNPKRKPTKEIEFSAFDNYAKWVAEHFKNTNAIYEVWNEWIQADGKLNRNNALSKESAFNYIKLVNNTCLTLKKINPSNIVIAGGISPFDTQSNKWIVFSIKNGLADCIDGLSIHAYHYQINSKKLNYIETLDKISELSEMIFHETGKTIPLYITEIGVPTTKNAKYTGHEITNFYKNFLLGAKSNNNIKGVWWYDLINDGNKPLDIEDNFGLIERNFNKKELFYFLSKQDNASE